MTDEKEAPIRLAGLADLFLVQDRPIIRPMDDSVAQVICGHEQILRRGRGYAPAPIASPGMPGGILALGAHLKTMIALTRPGEVVVSQHIGDLETMAARTVHASVAADLTRLFAAKPRLAVRDPHPDYGSSRMAETTGLPVAVIPHHLAHVAAAMAEHAIAPPVLGVAWDGTGYGRDGTVWGGELLHVTKGAGAGSRICAAFRCPAVRRRHASHAALGLLYAAFGAGALATTDLPPVAAFSASERAVLGTMLGRGVNTPLCSSVGRLFDAFATLCGLRHRTSYEGQAAAELEWAAEDGAGSGCYPFPIGDDTRTGALILDRKPTLEAALADLRAGATPGRVSAALHRGLAAAIAAVAQRIGEHRVVLTGGCFQNARLTEEAVAALRQAGCEPLWHRRVPPNDGGIALGQAAWTAWCEAWGDRTCAPRCPRGS